MGTSTVAASMSRLLVAIENCRRVGNSEWKEQHESALASLCRDHLPSGSGFDAGTQLDVVASNPERLVFRTSFHHMDSHGGYDGWTNHTVRVRPLFDGIGVKVSGRDRDGIKDDIAEVFAEVLAAEVDASTLYRPANAPSASR